MTNLESDHVALDKLSQDIRAVLLTVRNYITAVHETLRLVTLTVRERNEIATALDNSCQDLLDTAVNLPRGKLPSAAEYASDQRQYFREQNRHE